MKIVYKSHFHRFLLLLSILAITVHADAQQFQAVTPKDNFTHFSAERTYADRAKLTALTPVQYRNNPDFGKRFTDSAQWYEQIDKRTLKTRTYSGLGNEIITENAYDNINYVDANGWMRAVDTKLKPYLNGWSAQQQEMPVYLYPDASTALSIGDNELMVFNKNVKFNHVGISATNYTVGDNGMSIKNAATNTDKIIRFGRGSIETDYSIKQPIKLNGDLIISEDIVLPAGYIISENTNKEFDADTKGMVVLDANGKEVAELKAPLCYDNHHKSSITGLYNIQTQAGGYKLEIQVSASWLNDPARQYPVTIDPLVVGKHVYWTSPAKIPSCLAPSYGSGTLTATVPGDITITHCIIEGSWYSPVIAKKHFSETFVSSCNSSYGPVTVNVDSPSANLPGLAYGRFDTYDPSFIHPITCCLPPQCTAQNFTVTMELTRDSGAVDGCDTSLYGWYDPVQANVYNYLGDSGTFEVFVAGRTVQDSTLTFTPTSVCANQCTVNMNVSVYYGVPPYTMTHPWAKKDTTFGKHLGCQTWSSRGTASLTLDIPNCPGPNCTPSTLDIPPPHIVDACGDSVKGLSFSIIGVNATPNVIATPVSKSICSGTNVDISLKSCEPGATFSWSGSDGTSGSGDTISDVSNNNTNSNIALNYTVTATGGGCTGNPFVFVDTITPFTVLISPSAATICDGSSVDITTSGDANTYSWSPSDGLSCTTCGNPVATPTVTTTYSVKGTNGGACSAKDSIDIVVNPIPTLTVSPTDTTIIVGQSVNLKAKSSGSVTWSPSTGLSSTTGDSIIATPTVTTTYTATVTLNSCTISEIVIIKVNASLYVPSGFTPNSGNENSKLYVLPELSVGLTLQEFRVYNRWGEEVFETKDITIPWDGTFNGKPQPMGTYVYYVQFLKEGQTQPIIIKGNVTLIR